jgi:flagellar secretion chaperone FliS
MFASSRNPSQAYTHVGIQTGVASATPHQLILMLFDGALLSLATATRAMDQGQIAEKGQAISRAIDIIVNGVKASLDFDDGTAIAEKLAALYDYMVARLLFANARNNPAALQEVRGLLIDLRGAWQEIASDPAVLSKNKGAD